MHYLEIGNICIVANANANVSQIGQRTIAHNLKSMLILNLLEESTTSTRKLDSRLEL